MQLLNGYTYMINYLELLFPARFVNCTFMYEHILQCVDSIISLHKNSSTKKNLFFKLPTRVTSVTSEIKT